MSAMPSVTAKSAETYDVVVVGAGFAGMYMLHRLRGQGMTARVYEQGSGVGGTWYWNRYPGARCDVESMQYSYSFSDELQQEWDWSERYAPQPEILKYANHVADRFDLRRDIQFDTRVERAEFDEDTNLWSVTVSDGKTVTAKYVVLATGCLSNARKPDINGLDRFKGKVYHTGNWPHEPVDFTGLRVGVIGTGSSSIQSVPVIAEQARHLTVFQRTANFSIPARNAALTDEERQAFRERYPEIRRFARGGPQRHYTELPDRGALDDGDEASPNESRWQRGGLAFLSVYNNRARPGGERHRREFRPRKITEIVKDPRPQAAASSDHPIGSKRICIDTDYYAAFNRPNVTLADIRSNPIEEITENAVRVGGKDYEIDALVLATGFDAMTGSVAKIDIRGRDGRTLNQKWAEGPRTYLGLMSAGFPNLFVITGPGSPSVTVEHDRLDRAACRLDRRLPWLCATGRKHHGSADRRRGQMVAHVNEVAHGTLYPQANSWYRRQHPRQAAHLHAHRRRRALPANLQ
jgi:cyclohexanone monooxygenase